MGDHHHHAPGQPKCELCGDGNSENIAERALATIAPMLATYGWACTGVFDPEGQKPGYNYTIGFRPEIELIIIGLPYQLAHALLTSAVEKRIELPGVYGGIIADEQVIARRVTSHDEEYTPGLARLWRRSTGQSPKFDLLQLLWPDELGVYPDHPDYSLHCPQPVLAPPL